ncbi:hypothetical protein ACFQY7_06515 [Actinomadura luteofluorescens]|uniref:hypothetical protein n=1 Tax=Actinomadura luteofluorescens TaxID=46163 RepID=UPI0036452D21
MASEDGALDSGARDSALGHLLLHRAGDVLGRPVLARGGLLRAAGHGGGPVALRLFGAAVGLAIAALSFRLALRLSNDRLAAALLPASGLIAAGLVWSERPLLLGVLALLVLVWVVDVPESPAGRRPHLVIPVVMWLWVNVHGSFALGFGFLALHLASRWLDGAPPWRDRERALARAGLLAGAVCLVNPYGPALLWFPVALLMRGDVLAAIIEWKSPDLRTPQGMMFALFLATVLVVLARARRRPSRRDVLVLVSFLLLALWAQRNIAAAPVVALPIVSRLAGRDAPRPDARRRPHWVPLALVLAFAVFWTADRLPRPAFGHDVTDYPVAAMRAVERNGLLGGGSSPPTCGRATRSTSTGRGSASSSTTATTCIPGSSSTITCDSSEANPHGAALSTAIGWRWWSGPASTRSHRSSPATSAGSWCTPTPPRWSTPGSERPRGDDGRVRRPPGRGGRAGRRTADRQPPLGGRGALVGRGVPDLPPRRPGLHA